MSLRTYSLIEHPAFVRFVSDAQISNANFEEAPAKRVRRQLPVLVSATSIADYLSVSHLMLKWMINKPERHYQRFEIQKKSGGIRIIDAPRTFLKVVQWWMLDTMLEWQPVNDAVYGFRRGKSYIDNAREHVGARHILNVDIEGFFPNTSAKYIYNVFKGLDYEDHVVLGLTQLTTLHGCLPQGAPSSPMLSNLAFEWCDAQLHELSTMSGIKYTRYADDLTFSSQERIPTEIVDKISAIISVMGYSLNKNKTKFMGPNQQQEVTGIHIGPQDVGLDRKFLNSCRGWFHTALVNPEMSVPKLDKLKGTVELLRQVNGRGSKKIMALGLEAVRRVEEARALLIAATMVF